MFVREVKPRIIRNSRKEKTIQIELKTYEGKFKASAPSGKSCGKYEVESWSKKGVDYSLKMLRVFAEKLKHENFIIKKVCDLKKLDGLIKIFEQKHGRMGGNVTYALHTVFLKAGAREKKKELLKFIYDSSEGAERKRKPKMPMLVGNCIGGGLHSKFVKGKRPDFQEFLLIPKTRTFSRAVTKSVHAYIYARRLLKARGRNDEGAWQTAKTNEEVLMILQNIGKKFGVRIGIDAAASVFYNRGYYRYKNKELIRDKVDQADYIERLVNKFDLFYVEDCLQEEDFSGFVRVSSFLKNRKKEVLIVGDDLTATNLVRVRRAIQNKAVNGVIIKPNQIGSLLQVEKVVEICKKYDVKIIFSHRSGETMDTALADFAVGFGADFLKCGIFGRERLIKLRRVMEIEKGLR